MSTVAPQSQTATGSPGTAGCQPQSPQGGQNIFNSEVGALEFLQRNPEGTMIPPSQTYNYVMFPGEEQNIKILQREEFGGPNSLKFFG